MKKIQSSVSIINEKDAFRKIEMIGRTCYKSTSAMTDETAHKFYSALAARNHTAMLEHAWFTFYVTEEVYGMCISERFLYSTNTDGRMIVSGNLRAWNEAKIIPVLAELYAQDELLVYKDVPKEELEKRVDGVILTDADEIAELTEAEYAIHKCVSFKFICDRGVTHEMVRHRPASFAQESTRYCNYGMEKFGSEITVIEPAFLEGKNPEAYRAWELGCEAGEKAYFAMLDAGATPQEARAVLPNSLKTEIIMSANVAEWDHFFNLRSRGTTGAPHPDMKRVADIALELFEQNIRKF